LETLNLLDGLIGMARNTIVVADVNFADDLNGGIVSRGVASISNVMNWWFGVRVGWINGRDCNVRDIVTITPAL